jgi:hypothetical protein
MAECQWVQLKVSIVFWAAEPNDIGARAYKYLVPLGWSQHVQNGQEFHVTLCNHKCDGRIGYDKAGLSGAYEL